MSFSVSINFETEGVVFATGWGQRVWPQPNPPCVGPIVHITGPASARPVSKNSGILTVKDVADTSRKFSLRISEPRRPWALSFCYGRCSTPAAARSIGKAHNR